MRLLILIFLLSTAFSCHQKQKQQAASNKEIKENLIKANIASSEKEGEQIQRFIERKKWTVKETGTGLRYFIYQANDTGEQAKNGKRATVNYEASLLNGDVVYSSKDKGTQEFMIGMDNVESGLHEGILLMKTGEKAKFILPSHLAHGLSGDQNKIPPKSTVVFDIELINLK